MYMVGIKGSMNLTGGKVEGIIMLLRILSALVGYGLRAFLFRNYGEKRNML